MKKGTFQNKNKLLIILYSYAKCTIKLKLSKLK